MIFMKIVLYSSTSLAPEPVGSIPSHPIFLIFIPEDGGSIFLRNVGTYLQVHTALQLRTSTPTPSPF